MQKQTKAILLILLVLIADQALKIWIKTDFRIGQSLPIFGNWFKLYFIENNGMAFGMQFGGVPGKIALSLFRILAIIGIAWFIRKMIIDKAPTGAILSVSLIFAGAFGNIIDSMFYGVIFSKSTHLAVAEFLPEAGGYAAFLQGRVVDMLYFPIVSGTFPGWLPFWGNEYFEFFRPVFNLADSAITAGVVLILVFYRPYFQSLDKKKSNVTEDAAPESVN